MNLSNQDVQLAQAMFESSSTQKHPLGTRGCSSDGRVYRYCKAGVSDLTAGNVIQAPANIAGALVRPVNTTTPSGAYKIGDTAIIVTCGSSIAANFYQEGYLVIASGTGQGYLYSINNHLAVSTGANGTFNLYAEDAVVVAITSSTTVSLLANKYSGVIQIPATTATGVVVGVATYVITAAQFGWIQTWGPAAVLGTDTTAIGAAVYAPANSAGAVSGFTAATLLTGQQIGHLMTADVAAQMVPVDLTISP